MYKLKNKSVKFRDNHNYLAIVSFNCKGRVSKNDVLGVIFGQTKEIIDALSYQHLQNTQQIGRVSIDCQYNAMSECTVGKVSVPIKSSRKKAAYIAAVLQLIEKIGAHDTKFEVISIKDNLYAKKYKLIEYAEKIQNTKFEQLPLQLTELKILEQNHNQTLIQLGSDHWGGTQHTCTQVYLVEGRADIQNLALLDIHNTISLNGAHSDFEVLDTLIKDKELTIIPDGDRGGHDIFAKVYTKFYNLITNVVKLPLGYKVETTAIDKLKLIIEQNTISTEEFITASPYLQNKKELINLKNEKK